MLPLSRFLMFSADDLVVGSETDDDGEAYETYRFVTTVAHARRRLEERGVTLQLCRDLYEQFYEPNEASFESYKSALARRFATREHLPLSGELDDEFYRPFPDADFCLDLRLILDVADPNDAVVLDLTELLHDGCLDRERVSELYSDFFALMVRRINLDYRIYGFVIDQDPRLRIRLRERIEVLSEDDLIRFILLPLLARMGFDRLRRVDFHGPGEFGSDILPFRYRTPLGTIEYYALQAKVVPIHGSLRSQETPPKSLVRRLKHWQ